MLTTSCMVTSSSSWTDNGRPEIVPGRYFSSGEKEGAGLLLCSMMSPINGHNLLLWQKNRSKEDTSFGSVI